MCRGRRLRQSQATGLCAGGPAVMVKQGAAFDHRGTPEGLTAEDHKASSVRPERSLLG